MRILKFGAKLGGKKGKVSDVLGKRWRMEEDWLDGKTVKNQRTGAKVSSFKFQVSGFKFQVSRFRFKGFKSLRV